MLPDLSSSDPLPTGTIHYQMHAQIQTSEQRLIQKHEKRQEQNPKYNYRAATAYNLPGLPFASTEDPFNDHQDSRSQLITTQLITTIDNHHKNAAHRAQTECTLMVSLNREWPRCVQVMISTRTVYSVKRI